MKAIFFALVFIAFAIAGFRELTLGRLAERHVKIHGAEVNAELPKMAVAVL